MFTEAYEDVAEITDATGFKLNLPPELKQKAVDAFKDYTMTQVEAYVKKNPIAEKWLGRLMTTRELADVVGVADKVLGETLNDNIARGFAVLLDKGVLVESQLDKTIKSVEPKLARKVMRHIEYALGLEIMPVEEGPKKSDAMRAALLSRAPLDATISEPTAPELEAAPDSDIDLSEIATAPEVVGSPEQQGTLAELKEDVEDVLRLYQVPENPEDSIELNAAIDIDSLRYLAERRNNFLIAEFGDSADRPPREDTASDLEYLGTEIFFANRSLDAEAMLLAILDSIEQTPDAEPTTEEEKPQLKQDVAAAVNTIRVLLDADL
jgi:hypothetical protein